MKPYICGNTIFSYGIINDGICADHKHNTIEDYNHRNQITEWESNGYSDEAAKFFQRKGNVIEKDHSKQVAEGKN